MSDIIRLEGVSKVYQNGSEPLRVLDTIDLSIPATAVAVVTGESGSGKSTLLHLLGGMDKPTVGSIVVAGFTVDSAGESQLSTYRASTIGFVFQFHHLLRDFTALENVMMPALMRGMERGRAAERARELLDAVGITGRIDAYPGELSGGERQRTAVARAVMNDPEVVLADEPTGSLDEAHSREVESLLFSLVRELGKTLVLVTHNARLAEYGDLHLRLSGGRVQTLSRSTG